MKWLLARKELTGQGHYSKTFFDIILLFLGCNCWRVSPTSVSEAGSQDLESVCDAETSRKAAWTGADGQGEEILWEETVVGFGQDSYTFFNRIFYVNTSTLRFKRPWPNFEGHNQSKNCLFAQYLPNCWMKLNRVCMDTTWNHDEQLITFGDLDSIIKVTAAYKHTVFPVTAGWISQTLYGYNMEPWLHSWLHFVTLTKLLRSLLHINC